MMDEKQSKDIATRLKKIEGQVRGITRMVEEGRYCIDILSQTRAITSGVKKVEEKIMYQHLHTCVAESMQSGNKNDKDQKIDEIMNIFAQLRKGT